MAFTQILDTVIDNGRITAQDQEEFEAQLRAEIESEASEQGLKGLEIEQVVEFALNHASL